MLKLSRNILTILFKILEYYVILPKIFLQDTKKNVLVFKNIIPWLSFLFNFTSPQLTFSYGNFPDARLLSEFFAVLVS